MRLLSGLCLILCFTVRLAAAPGGLLPEALQACSGEQHAWAFTQQVREFDGDRVKEERVERYDPSRPGVQRWTLIAINGHPPTTAEAANFLERKNRKKRLGNKSPADFIDFNRVAVAAESAALVRYQVPLRDDVSRFVPVDKVAITVTVNKDSQAVEQVSARLREPIRVAFGVARVTDLTLDLDFKPVAGASTASAGTGPQPVGTARATLFKFGSRADFAWSDFRRVTPFALLAANL